MIKRILAISIILIAASQQHSFAQTSSKDTVIKGATIEIIQSYKPEVTQAPKPELLPSLPPIDTSKPNYNYNVPDQTVYYTYSSLPLRPLALGIMAKDTTFPNYVKLGGGNLSTIYFDAGIGGLYGADYNSIIHLQHLSQKGNIVNQKSSLTSLDAKGTYYKDDNAINAGIGIFHNQYNQYGYDHDIYTYGKDSLKQAFTGFNLNLGLNSNQMGYKKLSFSPNIGLAFYGDNNDASEIGFNISAPFTYNIDSTLQVYLGANAMINQFKNNIGNQSNNIIQFSPGVKLYKNGFNIRAGIYPTLGSNSQFYWLPDLEASFSIPNTQFMITAGWISQLKQNTYQYLSSVNPYMSNLYTVQQTKTTEVFGELKSNISNNLSFSGRVGWWQYNNLPLYINDTITDGRKFNILYDNKINALSLEASIRYQIAHSFVLGINGQWNNFYSSSYSKVWNQPGVTFGINMSFMPIKKLTFSTSLSVLDELYALTKSNKTVKLKTVLDLSAKAEYTILQRVGLFINVNNILNSANQRWYGYDAYGINIYGGIKFNF